jgi:hypothetical protein
MAYHKEQPAPNRDVPHTKETKKKISESCKKVGVGRRSLGGCSSRSYTESTKERTRSSLIPMAIGKISI